MGKVRRHQSQQQLWVWVGGLRGDLGDVEGNIWFWGMKFLVGANLRMRGGRSGYVECLWIVCTGLCWCNRMLRLR